MHCPISPFGNNINSVYDGKDNKTSQSINAKSAIGNVPRGYYCMTATGPTHMWDAGLRHASIAIRRYVAGSSTTIIIM